MAAMRKPVPRPNFDSSFMMSLTDPGFIV